MFGLLNVYVYVRIIYASCLLFLYVIGRHVHVKVFPTKGFPGEALQEEMANRLVDCVYRCTGIQDCMSMSFNKVDGICKHYSSALSLDIEPGSPLLYASMATISDNGETSSPHPRLVVATDKITYQQAERECEKLSTNLLMIDSAEKQAEAVKLAKNSDLDTIAIGLHMCSFKWCYADGRRVSYTAWAPLDVPGFYVGMSKEYDYKWVAVTSRFDGYFCDH